MRSESDRSWGGGQPTNFYKFLSRGCQDCTGTQTDAAEPVPQARVRWPHAGIGSADAHHAPTLTSWRRRSSALSCWRSVSNSSPRHGWSALSSFARARRWLHRGRRLCAAREGDESRRGCARRPGPRGQRGRVQPAGRRDRARQEEDGHSGTTSARAAIAIRSITARSSAPRAGTSRSVGSATTTALLSADPDLARRHEPDRQAEATRRSRRTCASAEPSPRRGRAADPRGVGERPEAGRPRRTSSTGSSTPTPRAAPAGWRW